MKVCACSPSGKDAASQAPHTTPPAAPENPTRCSRSPQHAHAPELGRQTRSEQQLQAELQRSRAPAGRCAIDPRAAGLGRLLVEQRQLAAEQVEHPRVRLGRLEQAPHRVARARGRVQRVGVARAGADSPRPSARP